MPRCQNDSALGSQTGRAPQGAGFSSPPCTDNTDLLKRSIFRGAYGWVGISIPLGLWLRAAALLPAPWVEELCSPSPFAPALLPHAAGSANQFVFQLTNVSFFFNFIYFFLASRPWER